MNAFMYGAIRLLAEEGEHGDITQTPSAYWPERRDHLRRHRIADHLRPAVQVGRAADEEGAGRPHREDPEGARRRGRTTARPPTPRPPRSARPRATSTPSGRGSWPRPMRRPPPFARTAPAGWQPRSPTSRPRRRRHRGRHASRRGRAARRDRPPVQCGHRPRGQRLARRRHPPAADRELHHPSRSQRMSDNRIDGYARALFEIARAEGTLDEVEDELFRFARSFESNDALRNALTDEQIPAATPPGDRRGPARRQGHRHHDAAGRPWSSAPVVPATCRRSSTGSSHAGRAAKNLEVAEVRTVVPLTDDQQTASPRRSPTPPASRST